MGPTLVSERQAYANHTHEAYRGPHKCLWAGFARNYLCKCPVLVISCKMFLVIDDVFGSEFLYGDCFNVGKRFSIYMHWRCRYINWWATCSNLVFPQRMIKVSKNNRSLPRAMGHKLQSQNDDYCFNAFLCTKSRFNHSWIPCEIFGLKFCFT